MASTDWPRTGERGDDRRSCRRYPLQSDVAYKIVRHERMLEVGSGHTVNVSASGVLFKSGRALPVGTNVELSIAWPARLDNKVRLQLCIVGRTMWSDSNSTAVKIQRYAFRTAGDPAAHRADAKVGQGSN